MPMNKVKKTIAAALTGLTAWWPWPPVFCAPVFQGTVSQDVFCSPAPVPPPPTFPSFPPRHACPLILKPVCGINGMTYDNSCIAWPIPVAHDGPCFVPRPTPIPTPTPTPPPWPSPWPTPPISTPAPWWTFPTEPIHFITFCDPSTGVCIPRLNY